jgi:hypothetical protein
MWTLGVVVVVLGLAALWLRGAMIGRVAAFIALCFGVVALGTDNTYLAPGLPHTVAILIGFLAMWLIAGVPAYVRRYGA